MASSALNLLQKNPTLTTNSPTFRDLNLDDAQRVGLAHKMIDSQTFVGQTYEVQTSTGSTLLIDPVTDDTSIKRYLKAFIDVDRSALETYFPGFNAAEAKRTVAHEVIDKRHDLYRLYLEYKRGVVERTRRGVKAPPHAPEYPETETSLHPVPSPVQDRDGGVCRVSGIASRDYWNVRRAEAVATNVGYGHSSRCEVTHAIPWNADQPYWELVRRLFGVSNSSSSGDIPENAILLHSSIRRCFQTFMIYFDPGFILRHQQLNNIELSVLTDIPHVRHGHLAIDRGFINSQILPPSSAAIPDVCYLYFLLHKLVGDIVYMAGGRVTLGLDEFDLDEDSESEPWTPIHVVSKVS